MWGDAGFCYGVPLETLGTKKNGELGRIRAYDQSVRNKRRAKSRQGEEGFGLLMKMAHGVWQATQGLGTSSVASFRTNAAPARWAWGKSMPATDTAIRHKRQLDKELVRVLELYLAYSASLVMPDIFSDQQDTC